MAYVDKYRNRNRFVFLNSDELYEDILRRKRITSLKQYQTRLFTNLRSKPGIETSTHIWKTGDRFFKLADEFYSDPTMWWVIALYNQAPTEFHLKLGDVIYVPTPLETVLFYIGY